MVIFLYFFSSTEHERFVVDIAADVAAACRCFFVDNELGRCSWYTHTCVHVDTYLVVAMGKVVGIHHLNMKLHKVDRKIMAK